jgi:hypothetical protein
LKLLLGLSLLCPLPAVGQAGDYDVFFAQAGRAPGKPAAVIIRRFDRDHALYYLAVDPETMETEIVPAAALKVSGDTLAGLGKAFSHSAYFKALADAGRNSLAIQDAGITHSLPPERGVCLTIDLCPSGRPLDRFFFNDLIAAFGKVETPVPLAIAVSGLWMEKHPQDLSWLAGLARSRLVRIDWINHSYHHQYDPKLPLKMNFLLEKGVNLDDEILLTEKKMIACGLTPSVFFRFPGLVSDQEEFARVLAFGLIPVGSDAWLAKRQDPKPGSIVLIHGNGNEPLGIKKFLSLVAKEKKAIKGKDWLLFDLRAIEER